MRTSSGHSCTSDRTLGRGSNYHMLTVRNLIRYTRSALPKSRISAYGSGTIRALAHTTCTRNIEKCPGPRRWMLYTKTWQPGTVLALGQFMYVAVDLSLPYFIVLIGASPQILKVVEIEKTDDVKRPYTKQLLSKNLRFPLPHRVAKTNSKSKLFAAHRPSTFA